eukprot:SAG22_NODE_804_length_7097_cov_173.117176_4_plen_453_part_00
MQHTACGMQPMRLPAATMLLAAASMCITAGSAANVLPAIPTGLRCGKATASSVTLEWQPAAAPAERAAGALHLYDLEAGTTRAKAEAFPFSSITVPAASTSATIVELKHGTDYFFKLRVHCGVAASGGLAGCAGGDLQMISGWSNFTAAIPCTTATLESGAAAASGGELLPQPLVETFWLEAWRVTENQLTTPDFLANHNSGDLDGDVAFLSHSGGTGTSNFFDFMTSPRVRYCVEIAKVDLSSVGRTSSYPPFLKQNETFSDYASCNGFGRGGAPYAPGPPDPLEWQNYSCLCDNHIDRTFAHQTKAQLCGFCGDCGGEGGFGMTCNCSESSLAASRQHVGFMPFVLPIPNMWGPPPPPTPGPPIKPMGYGGWYHFPSGGKCPDDGTPVGTDGCTWRRAPRAHMLYGQDLLDAGWNATSAVGRTGDGIIAGNKKAVQASVGKLTSKCCGCD